MLKITDPNYFLPDIEALTPGRVLSSGRTRPMLIGGVCAQTGAKGEYVVKWKRSKELLPEALLNELWGAFVGLELDLEMVEPVKINVSREFVGLLDNKSEIQPWASQSIGYNFGSTYDGMGYQEIVPGQSISTGLQSKLVELFAFDVLLGNPDRRADKPNFLTNGKNLLIYDHEMAFSFIQLLSFARNPKPWEILPGDLEWIYRNFCYQQLKGHPVDFGPFIDKLTRINSQFWEKAMDVTPEDWKNDHITSIQHHVNQIVEHRNDFAFQLNRLFS